MRETFTCNLKDDSKESIDAAKKLMWECASEMGFCGHDEFKLSRVHDHDTGKMGWRLDVNFHT